MFARYVYKAGATVANVLADVCALIAGAALADLSADCDKTQTTVEGAAPGWRIDDVQAGYRILSAPLASAVGRKTYKVAVVGSEIRAYAAESWDSAAHAGVNVHGSGPDLQPNVAAAGGVLYVMALPDVAMVSAAGDERMFLLGELVDLTPSCAGRPSWFVIGRRTTSSAYAYVPRVKRPNNAGDDLLVSVTMRYFPPVAGGVLGANEERYYALHDIYIEQASYQGYPWLGRVRGVKVAMATAQPMDVYIAGDDRYVIVRPYYQNNECFGVLRG